MPAMGPWIGGCLDGTGQANEAIITPFGGIGFDECEFQGHTLLTPPHCASDSSACVHV